MFVVSPAMRGLGSIVDEHRLEPVDDRQPAVDNLEDRAALEDFPFASPGQPLPEVVRILVGRRFDVPKNIVESSWCSARLAPSSPIVVG